jgi:hypothetical protein
MAASSVVPAALATSAAGTSNTANIKMIVKEDFPQSDQDLVDKLAYIINPVFTDIKTAFAKGIDITYLTREITSFTITSVAGKPNPKAQFKTALTKPVGVTIISCINAKNVDVYPTSAPFISWSINGTIITVNNITGLQDNTPYNIVLEVIS